MKSLGKVTWYVGLALLAFVFAGCATQTVAPSPDYYGGTFQPLLTSPLAGHPHGREGIYVKAEPVGLTMDFVKPLPQAEGVTGVGTLLVAGSGVALRGSYLDVQQNFYVAAAVAYDARTEYDWREDRSQEYAALAFSVDAAYIEPFETDWLVGAYGPRFYAYADRRLDSGDSALGVAGGFGLTIQHNFNEHFSAGAELGGLLTLDSRYRYPRVIVSPGFYLSVRF